MIGIARHHSEWLSLIEVSGPFLTLPVLVRVFPQGLPKVDGKKLGRLRAAYEEWANAQDAKAPDASALHATWVQLVLGELLEFDDRTLRTADRLPAGLDVPLAEHHETLRPSMAIVEPSGRAKAGTPQLLIAVWPSDQDLESAVPAARWAASPLERMTQICRSTGVRLGLVTNGERWTVVDAPVGQSAGYASWYAGLWLQEPITLAAFDALLGVRRFFAVADTDTIETLLDESVAFQQEVTDQLGYQVRRAVEVLVQALDRADLDRKRELLRDVPPARLYDAALTVMMRLVFLFCAEERGLLLLGDETYDANYAVSTLRALLREEADRVGVEVLERRQDAWARLLANFRAVHGGVEHEALRLPALGGSLFDPDRFPFLEGRAAGTSWRDTPASPLPIDNRTVLHLLEALQLLRMRGDGGRVEARKLSYRALDIEQIGHVYEGLLDHVAVRVDVDTLGLAGSKEKEPELSIDELDRARHRGKDELIEFLKEHTGRSTSALHNDLDANIDEDAQQRLFVACGNDKVLLKRVAPYHALLRKDVWGYPQVYRADSFMVTGGPERRQTGTHYTPKSLTEQIVTETLEPLVYVGPADGKPRDAWKLRSAAELLELKICDMAMGSGAFLVQVCRRLAERVVEAWEEAERRGAVISAEGEVLEKAAGRDLLPSEREERLSFARRLVAERCIYGVDINPMAVELAKLSLWLVTLAKGRPFGFLDHNLRSGDSLLGITSLDQLENFHLDPARGAELHVTLFDPLHRIRETATAALGLRLRLREIRIADIDDVRAMERLDAQARALLRQLEVAADLLIGAAISVAGSRNEVLDKEVVALASALKSALDGDGNTTVLEQQARQLLDTDCPGPLRPRRPFHWPLEFPEVFTRTTAGFNAVIGNPPFLGGSKLSRRFGDLYPEHLRKVIAGDQKGKADLCVYFLLRSFSLLADDGCQGLVLSTSIAEGDNRAIGLSTMLANDSAHIFRASRTKRWPGAATVTISQICVRKGPWGGLCCLDEENVAGISAALEALVGSAHEPRPLRLSKGQTWRGTEIKGPGFVLDAAEALHIIESDKKYLDVLFPYISGSDINTDPQHFTKRYVINFHSWDEQRARRYPKCFSIVEKLVKPYRDTLDRQIHEPDYWKFWDKREAEYEKIKTRATVLATSLVNKHVAFAFVRTGCIYSNKVQIFTYADHELFAVLQSSLQYHWAWKYSPRNLELLAYSPRMCFEAFPFPVGLVPKQKLGFPVDDRRREVLAELASVGRTYESFRARILVRRNIGLTPLYNLLHDETHIDADLAELRDRHVEMDYAVARAYGWEDLDLGHGFHEVRSLPGRDRVRFTISGTAAIEVLNRLTELNRLRYEEEQATTMTEQPRTRNRAKAPPASQGTLPLYDAPDAKVKKAPAPAKKTGTGRTRR